MEEFFDLIELCKKILQLENKDLININKKETPLEKSVNRYLGLFEMGKLEFEKYWEDIFLIYKMKRKKILSTLRSDEWIKQNIVIWLGRGWNEDMKKKNVKINISEIYKKSLKISRMCYEDSIGDDYLDDEKYNLPGDLILNLLNIFKEGVSLTEKYIEDYEKLENIIEKLENEEEYSSDEEIQGFGDMGSFIGNALGGMSTVFQSLQSGDEDGTISAVTDVVGDAMSFIPEDTRKNVVGGIAQVADTLQSGNFNIDDLSSVISGVLTPLAGEMGGSPPEGVTDNGEGENKNESLSKLGNSLMKLVDNLDD